MSLREAAQVLEGASEITRELLGWIQEISAEVPVFARGSADAAADGIEIRLLAITPSPVARTAFRPTVLALDYLVTVRLKDALEEHRLVAELMFGALERRDLTVIDSLPRPEAATKLGVPAGAGFIVRTHLSRDPERVTAPRVRFPLTTEWTGIGRVEGVVLGPEDTPIAGAIVTLTGLGKTSRTDRNGHFRMAGPLPDTASIRLKARAKGVETEITTPAGEPAVLHLPLET
jgi:hypothetical protein